MIKKITLALGMTACFAMNAQTTTNDTGTPKVLAQNNIELKNIDIARFTKMNVKNDLNVVVKNNGSNIIKSFILNWNDGSKNHGAKIYTLLKPGESKEIIHPTPVIYNSMVEKNLEVSISSVNGDEIYSIVPPILAKINTVTFAATKKVLFEEGTGTWCGYCPRGAVVIEHMVQYDGFIGIAVHKSDPMEVSDYSPLSFWAYPLAKADRAIDVDVDIPSFEDTYNTRMSLTVPAGISLVQTGAGSNIAIKVTATFNTTISSANYRLAVIIMEDGVTGTTTDYDQSNYFTGGPPMGGYESLPNPVPASQMTYNHTSIAILGGFSGQIGSIPTSITTGDEVSYTFNYTVPTTSNRTKLHAVAVLIDGSNGEIINAEEISLSEALGVNDVAETITLTVYPNPAADNLNISFNAKGGDYSISIIDTLGRTVLSNTYNDLSGFQNHKVNINNIHPGNYIISISNNKTSFSKKIIIN